MHETLLLRWHYSPMWTFASLMDFSQTALFFDLSFQLNTAVSSNKEFNFVVWFITLDFTVSAVSEESYS